MDARSDRTDGSAASVGTAIVVTGSEPLDPAAVAAAAGIAAAAGSLVVIAADGGLDHARRVGLVPDVLVGDLDSVSAEGLAWATSTITVERHDVDKALTDTELAVAHAATLAPQRLVLVAGRGDRLDHAVAAIGVLGSAALAAILVVEGWWGDDHLLVGRAGRGVVLDDPPGTTFSVLALHGPCRGVTITGARWPLVAHDLAPLVGTGVSNEVATPPVHVDVTHGVVTVIVPGAQP